MALEQNELGWWVWVPDSVGGGVSPLNFGLDLVKPLASDFSTWANQDSGTITDDDTMLVINTGTAKTGNSVQARLRPLPATTTWVVTLGVFKLYPWKNYMAAGITLQESGTGKIVNLTLGNPTDAGLCLNKYTNATTFGSNILALAGGGNEPLAYLRFERSGANIQPWVSFDGKHYFKFGPTFALTDHFTTAPDKWGFAIDGNNGATPNLIVEAGAFHWSEVA